MKEVLSLFTFGISALFFVVFFAALKPISSSRGRAEYAQLLQHESFAYARLPLADICRSVVARCRAAIVTMAAQDRAPDALYDCKVPCGENYFPIVHYSNQTPIS